MTDKSARNTITGDSVDVSCFCSHNGANGIHVKLCHCLDPVSACNFGSIHKYINKKT